MPPNPHFQIISDLHLETPLHSPSYTHFSHPTNFPLRAPNLFLLGDTGLLSDAELLLTFLRSLLQRDIALRIFYIMGNHEPYHMTLPTAVSRLEEWELELRKEFGARFWFLNRRRVDLDERVTILGCTLWTHVCAEHAQDVVTTVKDFKGEKGIWGRGLEDHNAEHARDLAWLNATIGQIELQEPEREVLVLTHHSPSTDVRANDARFAPERSLNSGFRTDLSGEVCWRSRSVKVWAFGHTHFSCQFVDGEEGRSKLVVANQKGYAYAEGKGNWEVKPVVVGKMDGEWRVLVEKMEGR